MQRKVTELNGLAATDSERFMEAKLATPIKPVRHGLLHETQAPAPVGGGDTAQSRGVQVLDVMGAICQAAQPAAATAAAPAVGAAATEHDQQAVGAELLASTKAELRACLYKFVEDAQSTAAEHDVKLAEHQLLNVEAAIDRICNGLSADVLQLQRSATLLFWDKVHAEVIVPGLVMASGEAAGVLGVRPWRVLTAAMEHVAEGMTGPGLLLAQIKEFKSKLHAFWEKYEELQQTRRKEQAEHRSALAMEGVAAAAMAGLGLRGRGFGPGGGRAGMYETSVGTGAGSSSAAAISGVGAALHFVQSELQTFLQVGALERWDPTVHGPAVVHPMSVAVHPWSGKRRLCIDANYVNIFERYEPVQFELLPDAFPLIQPQAYGYGTDCTKGYFHLQLHPSVRRFLAVRFQGVTYVFKALPFGLSSAVKAFTDTMIVAYLPMRRQGMRFSSMIDDRIGLARSRAACWLDIYIAVRFVCGLGFHLGLAKSVLWPQQRLLYLGLLLRLDTLQCLVPAAKLQKFDHVLDTVLASAVATPRQLAALAGLLISLSLAVPLSKLYTRQLFLALSHKVTWDQALPVGPELRAHLLWLKRYVPAHNGCRWFRRQPGVLLVTDASVKGVGGLASTAAGSSDCSGVQVTLQGQLPEVLFLESSTCREAAGMVSLLTTLLAHPQWGALLRHRAVKILTDNQGVASDVQHMKGCPAVFVHVQRLYELAAQYDFDLIIEWRPREYELLQLADLHSKMVDVADWGLSTAVYADLCQQLHFQPAVDWFARPWSAKCPRFYCRFLMPGCAGVDAFDFSWALPGGALSYICPPHMLVAKVVRKVLDDRASCVLVLPAWYKSWHAMLSLLPVRQMVKLPASAIVWGDRAPAPDACCQALLAGLKAYLVRF